VYVVALGVPDGVSAYEFSVSGVSAANVAQSSYELAGPAPAFLGDPDASNFIVGAGDCIADDAGATVLVTLTLFAYDAVPSDAALCIGPASPSSFDPSGPWSRRASREALSSFPASSACAVRCVRRAVGDSLRLRDHVIDVPPITTGVVDGPTDVA